jgi:plastocyanin
MPAAGRRRRAFFIAALGNWPSARKKPAVNQSRCWPDRGQAIQSTGVGGPLPSASFPAKSRRVAGVPPFQQVSGDNMLSFKRWLVVGLSVGVCASAAAPAHAQTGTIEGQFVLDGDVPNNPPKIKKGDPAAKDPAVCAVEDVPDESLVVDPASKGIANVIVFLRKAPANMPADLKASKEKEVVLDQKGCRFLPHVLAVRTDQTVKCINSDGAAHNVNIAPFINPPANFVVPANDQTGNKVTMKSAESLPVGVKCDIHSWMNAFWVVTDHPYVAVTDAQGKFKIEGLPAGDHTFSVWQESAGWINRTYKVSVKAGANALPPVKVPVASFKKK